MQDVPEELERARADVLTQPYQPRCRLQPILIDADRIGEGSIDRRDRPVDRLHRVGLRRDVR